MIVPPVILLHSRDADLLQRGERALRDLGEIRATASRAELERALDQGGPAILLFDLRTSEARDLLPDLLRNRPDLVVVALGERRSDPALMAEAMGAYAVEEPDVERRRLVGLVTRALEHMALQQENAQLREEAARPAREPRPGTTRPERERADAPLSLRHFSRALRHFDNVDAMVDRIADGLAAAAMVSRAGIFGCLRNSGTYRLLAGINCLDDTRRVVYPESDVFVRWLERHTHLVARANLDQVPDAAERTLLKKVLDTLGAEILAPLQARGRIFGWFFVGHRATGRPFDYADLEDLSSAADHISTALENALLYEEVARQKSLAETLLHSLPTGIIAADEQGVVRWFSTAAHEILMVTPDKVIGQPAEVLGSRLADMIRRTIEGELFEFPQAWTDPLTRRSVFVQTRRLGTPAKCLGAVAMIQDITAQRALQEKQEQLERAAFWNELAASMSHEIRNPLVAIKTFAQLLPERYGDDEFRSEFSKLVSSEVDRLNSIIDQINDFAHPPELKFHALDVRQPLKRSLDQVLPNGKRNGIRLSAHLDDDLPPVWGDEKALTDCFTHLLRNSVEALTLQKDGQIDLTATRLANGDSRKGVAITVRDNGSGIPASIRDKVFSPFCTTKARGMGLGLPIVKRTVVDHNGRVQIDTGERGTAITVMLPTAGNGDNS